MHFAVTHHGRPKDGEYQDYFRVLNRQLIARGMMLDQLPRVRDETNGWLFAWENEKEASSFAEELRKQTRDREWQVRRVKGELSVGPVRPLEIEVGQQSSGWIFGLDTFTKRMIEARFPGSCQHQRVSVASATPEKSAERHAELKNLADQVLPILTGLSTKQLSAFESFRVVDPVTGKELVAPTSIR